MPALEPIIISELCSIAISELCSIADLSLNYVQLWGDPFGMIFA
jgi:hypothetical protein